MPRAGCTSQSRASAQARGARDAGASAPLQTGRGGGGGQPLQWPIWGLPPSPRFLCPHRHPSWRGHCLVLGDRCLDLRGRKAEATLGGHAEPWGGGTHREPLPYLVKSVAEGAGLAGVDPGPTAAPGQDQQPGTPAASGPHGGKGPASNARVLWAWGPSSTELGRREPGPCGAASSPPDPRTRPRRRPVAHDLSALSPVLARCLQPASRTPRSLPSTEHPASPSGRLPGTP